MEASIQNTCFMSLYSNILNGFIWLDASDLNFLPLLINNVAMTKENGEQYPFDLCMQHYIYII